MAKDVRQVAVICVAADAARASFCDSYPALTRRAHGAPAASGLDDTPRTYDVESRHPPQATQTLSPLKRLGLWSSVHPGLTPRAHGSFAAARLVDARAMSRMPSANC